MTKPVADKAEVALEYPDKLYIGTFEQSARFDAHLDETGVSLSLHRTGADDVRKSVRMHFHFGLFADILRDLAKTASSLPATPHTAPRCAMPRRRFIRRCRSPSGTARTRRRGSAPKRKCSSCTSRSSGQESGRCARAPRAA
jgi:hypothetical protein